MKFYNEKYYHVIPVKELDRYALSFNARVASDEFWEPFNNIAYITPIAYSNWIEQELFMEQIFTLFEALDAHGVYYTCKNTPNDMIKQHLIVDCMGSVTLCNKHLLRKAKVKPRYTSVTWKKKIIKSLFPKATNPKTMRADIPYWVTKYI